MLETQWALARTTDGPLTVAMIDIDHFKLYNDHYGHAAGDVCLRMIADVIAAQARTTDLVARYGGEKFTVIFPGVGLESAAMIGERIRAAVWERQEPHARAERGVVTISVGIASRRASDLASAQELINLADVNLYEAKLHRNTVCGR